MLVVPPVLGVEKIYLLDGVFLGDHECLEYFLGLPEDDVVDDERVQFEEREFLNGGKVIILV